MIIRLKIFSVLILFSVLFACSASEKNNTKIDRFALVTRHNVFINAFDSLSSLSVGNGEFAFTVDATGLQTFPEIYKNGVPLGTMSEWGWHSFPNTKNFRREETYKYFNVEGKEVPYSVQWSEPGRKRDAADYFRSNPHRLHLGSVGLELLNSGKSAVNANEIQEINQKLNVWEGQITSSFKIENEKVDVITVCHPERDLIGVEINSEKIKNGLVGLKLRFPFPTANSFDDPTDWNNDERHYSEIIQHDQYLSLIHISEPTRRTP